MKKTILYHILPFVIACSTIYLFFMLISNKDRSTVIYTPSKISGKYANYEDSLAKTDLLYALHNKSLIIWGSSELGGTDSLGYITHNFFPKQFNIPTLAIGHAGNQSFSIMCQLAALNKHVKNNKMVFVISPGWFTNQYAQGTSSNSFIEFVDEEYLKKIYYSNLNSKYINYISNYIYRKRDDIHPMGYYTKRLMYKSWYKYLNIYDLFESVMPVVIDYIAPINIDNSEYKFKIKSVYNTNSKIPNWDYLKRKAINNFEIISSNNSMAINNTYYSNNIKGHENISQGIVAKENNIELSDFNMLISLINDLNINAVFIVQNLNPHVYINLEEVQPIIDDICNEFDKYNFRYYNMFTANKSEYSKGELTDAMHMGDLGWIKVNEFIYNALYNGKAIENNN